MRFYCFVNNVYMSAIQHGIQTAHAVSEMSFKTARNPEAHAKYLMWAAWHKTIIVLQGGNVENLLRLENEITILAKELELPAVSFREDEASLGGIITAVAVILPEALYDTEVVKDEDGYTAFKPPVVGAQWISDSWSPEHKLLSLIKLARLA